MTIQKEKYTVPAHESERTKDVTCDLCNRTCPDATDAYDGEIKWKGSDWDQANTTIRYSEGYDCPSGGHRQIRDYHICPKCFKEKLEPWLAAQGAQPTDSEVDW